MRRRSQAVEKCSTRVDEQHDVAPTDEVFCYAHNLKPITLDGLKEVNKHRKNSEAGLRLPSGKTVHDASHVLERMRPDQLRLLVPVGKCDDQVDGSQDESSSKSAAVFQESLETMGAGKDHLGAVLQKNTSSGSLDHPGKTIHDTSHALQRIRSDHLEHLAPVGSCDGQVDGLQDEHDTKSSIVVQKEKRNAMGAETNHWEAVLREGTRGSLGHLQKTVHDTSYALQRIRSDPLELLAPVGSDDGQVDGSQDESNNTSIIGFQTEKRNAMGAQRDHWEVMLCKNTSGSLKNHLGKTVHDDEPHVKSNGKSAIASQEKRESMGAQRDHWEAVLRKEENSSLNRIKKGLDYQALATLAYSVTKRLASDVVTPKTVSEAIHGLDREEWLKAIALENESINNAGVFTIVPIQKGKNLVGSRYLFKVKQDQHGLVSRLKVRLIAQGFSQIEGIDFFDVFAPVSRYTTIRTILAIAAERDLELHQMDVKTAFLNGTLEEEIYLKAPKGMAIPNGMCLKVNKGLYGLKQSPRIWNKNLHEFLEGQGFVRNRADPCAYSKHEDDGPFTMLAVFVDDIIIATDSKTYLEELRKAFKSKYKMDDIGNLEWCLGMLVERDRLQGTLKISQEQYIKDMLKRFGMEECNPVAIPADTNVVLCKSMSPSTLEEREVMKDKPYMSLVGSLMYASISARSDIAQAVGAVARYMNNPGIQHWNAAKRILRYLKGTMKLGITYGNIAMGKRAVAEDEKRGNKSSNVVAYADADYASCLDTRRSRTGYALFHNRGATAWESRSQPTCAKSTTEAEYMALGEACSEIKWQRQLLEDLTNQKQQGPTILWEDNKGAIALASDPIFRRRTKHIDVKWHFVRECQENGLVEIKYCKSADMIADILTKPIPRKQFERLRGALMGSAQL